MDKIRVVKLKKEEKWEVQRYKVLVGDIELSNQITEVSATIDVNPSGLTTVSMKFITNDFEWKDEE